MKKYLPVAVIVIVGVLAGCGNKTKDGDSTEIFDGKTLKGWKGDSSLWHVEEGVLIGETTADAPLAQNSFIIWQGGTPDDFELTLEYRLSSSGNSGINYRSRELPGIPFALEGYQFDMDGANHYTGQNYEERGRTTLAYQGQTVVIGNLPDSLSGKPVAELTRNNAWPYAEITHSTHAEQLKNNIRDNDWNHCRVVAVNNNLKHYINGILISEVTDEDATNAKMEGVIGLQLHMGPPMKVEFRNISLKEM